MIPLSLMLGDRGNGVGRLRDHAISLGSLAVVSLPSSSSGRCSSSSSSRGSTCCRRSRWFTGTSPLERRRSSCLALTLLGATLAGSTRMVRAGMLESLRSDYVEMARLNGLSERTVVLRYGFATRSRPRCRSAQNIQYLIGGIIVVEYLFNYPGIGKELVDVAIRDVRAGAVDRDRDRGGLHRREHRRRPGRRHTRAKAAVGTWLRRFAAAGRARSARPCSSSWCSSRCSGRSSPRSPERPIGIPYEAELEALLGTDFLGRDVLSRVLWEVGA